MKPIQRRENRLTKDRMSVEVLAPLINIVMSDLPGNPVVWDIW